MGVDSTPEPIKKENQTESTPAKQNVKAQQHKFSKGDYVEAFCVANDFRGWSPAVHSTFALSTPHVGFTEGWFNGRVASVSENNVVTMMCDAPVWFNRHSEVRQINTETNDLSERMQVSLPAHRVRPRGGPKPKLSIVVLRWGGYGKVEAVVEGDGGWGQTGSVASDTYIRSFFNFANESLGSNFEVLTLWVTSSADLDKLALHSGLLSTQLTGQKKALMSFLWPVEWQDAGDPRYAGYVNRKQLTQCFSAWEACGVDIKFPHNANLYSVFGSKDWTTQLCQFDRFKIPCTTKVPRCEILNRPQKAAQDALLALNTLRKHKAHWANQPAPEPIKAGVVKLGWSWEATDVWKWGSVHDMQGKLVQSMGQPLNQSSTAFVQEWVDMDFEMRLFAVNPPADLEPGQTVKPAHYIFNRWNRIDAEGKPREFEKLDRARVLKEVWVNDEAAMQMAERRTAELMTDLLIWLRGEQANPPHVMRFDFMVKRVKEGEVEVHVGEMTELGACMLGWQQGPQTVWQAVLDSMTGTKRPRGD